MKIKILVADDHPYFRQGIANGLRKYKDIEIVREAGNGSEVVDWLAHEKPVDVIILDWDMPKMSGAEVLHEIRLKSYTVKTIVVSMHRPDEIVQQVLEAGAQGYVCKDEEPEIVSAAIHAVMEDSIYLSESTNAALLRSIRSKSDQVGKPIPVISFSPRELIIIKRISQEMTNDEIAGELNLSLRTIEGIRHELIHRVGAKNSIGLILYAQQAGIL